MMRTFPNPKRPRPLLVSLSVAMACGLAVMAVYPSYLGPPSLVAQFVLATVAVLFMAPAVLLHARAIAVFGPRRAMLRQFLWLLLVLVVLPNADMALLLYVPGSPGWLEPLAWPLMLFGSFYYAVPADIGGERLFLLETLISPLGAAGILLSAAFWAVVALVLLAVLQFPAIRLARRRAS